MLTMAARGWRPALDSSRQYTAAWWVVAKVPFRCTRTTASKSSSDMEKSMASRTMPALLTSTSSRPNSSTAWRTRLDAPAQSATSS